MKWPVHKSQKLVSFLQSKLFPIPSGKALRRVLEANLCRINGKVERFGSASVNKGSFVELSETWESFLEPKEKASFLPLYEDEDLLIVNKPAGFVCKDEEVSGAFLIHRLDKETTGVLLLAKSLSFKEKMIPLFREKKIEKTYLTIVDGIPAKEKGIIQKPLSKKGVFQGQTRWGSSPEGLFAETHWQVLSRSQEASLLACQPITGRTHQIRVHLAEMGHPILVDRQYAEKYRSPFFANRVLLHAHKVKFVHPSTNELIEVEAPLPADFAEALNVLKLETLF